MKVYFGAGAVFRKNPNDPNRTDVRFIPWLGSARSSEQAEQFIVRDLHETWPSVDGWANAAGFAHELREEDRQKMLYLLLHQS